MPAHNANTYEKFWKKVQHGESNACWEWQGYRTRSGYGVLRMRGVKRISSNIAWESGYGPIPPGKIIMHTCDNPPCCNPAHLQLGTKAENNKDRMQKGRGRYYKGAQHASAKVNLSIAAEIRWLYAQGFSQQKIADEFVLGQATVSRIIRKELWV